MKISKLLVFALLVIGQAVMASSDESIFTTASKNMLKLNVKALAGGFMVIPVPTYVKQDQLTFNYKVKDIVVNTIPQARLNKDFGWYGEAVVFTAASFIACTLTVNGASSVLFNKSDLGASEKICQGLYLAFLASAAAEKTIENSNKLRFFK